MAPHTRIQRQKQDHAMSSSRSYSRAASFRAMNCAYCLRATGDRCDAHDQVLAEGQEENPPPTCPSYRPTARAIDKPALFDYQTEIVGQDSMDF